MRGHASIKAMFAVDLNGFCFGHYHECRADWTGDHVTDRNHSRLERFCEGDLSLLCSRVGLGEAADQLPKRTRTHDFASWAAPCARPRSCWAIYTYARDTGVVYNDLSVALFA